MVFSAKWTNDDSNFGYDYWYQPTHDVLISSEWGAPQAFNKGFHPDHVSSGKWNRINSLVIKIFIHNIIGFLQMPISLYQYIL